MKGAAQVSAGVFLLGIIWSPTDPNILEEVDK